jgi:hypothetical protein
MVMIQTKFKICSGCTQPKHIWKSHGKEKFCKECWYSKEPPKKPNPISVKMKDVVDEYTKIRQLFLTANPGCQAKLQGCQLLSSEVHHKAGRGENHLKISTWLAVCRPCHRWIEENPEEAKELGLSENRL